MRRLDVNWMQSIQYAFFAYICAQFGAQGALRQGLTLMVIPLVRQPVFACGCLAVFVLSQTVTLLMMRCFSLKERRMALL